MALKPSEVTGLTAAELAEVNRLESVIDDQLALRYDFDAQRARMCITGTTKVILALLDRYRAAGWRASATEHIDSATEYIDWRDGNYWEFILTH